MARALVVHATSLFVRGYLAAPTDMRSPEGEPNNALFGLSKALRRALAFKEPEHAVAVIESPAETAAWPPLLRPQEAKLEAILRAHGLEVVRCKRSAHVVASYVAAAIEDGHDVVIVSSDKRMAQLVRERVWWYDAYKDVRYTPELVRKRFEVVPQHVAGWLALVGDDDTLRGVKGIGKKGATGLVTTFGSIGAAIDRAEEADGRTGKALRASLEDAIRQVARAKLELSEPLPVPLSELAYEVPSASALNDSYRDQGFFSLLEAGTGGPAVSVTCCTTAAEIDEALAGLVGPIAIAGLIDGAAAVHGDLVGLALGVGDGAATYVPLGGDLLDALAPWLEDAMRPKVGHDVKSCAVALARRGLTLRGVVFDSACASHLADPSGMAPHDLPLVAKRRLRVALDEDEAILGVGRRRKRWAQLEVERAGARAGELADVAAKLWKDFEPTTSPERLAEYLELSEILVGMELNGIACDADDLRGAGRDFEATEKALEQQIHELAGKSFNLGSTKQLGSVLFEDLGLTIFKRTKTGWSTATEALERIANEHPIVPLVIRWRRLRRLRDSWVTALINCIDDDGRVRSSFHPARSFSGRLVNSQPDLGRVPGRTEEMARIRHAFAVPEGKTLLSVDYKQLGLYVLAHLTEDPALVEPLTRGDDMHTLTASAVLELPIADIGKDERQIGKVVNFATFAGQGPSALALQLDVSAKEAKAIVARFHRRYAVVREFQDRQLALARERGWVETISGRPWPIGGLSSADPQMLGYAERLARRATHEGSVADVTRRGLLLSARVLKERGLDAQPLLQVHDEVLFEVANEALTETARLAGDAMRSAFELKVPLRVSCKAGPNWAELTPLD